jgi:hypothetical protein
MFNVLITKEIKRPEEVFEDYTLSLYPDCGNGFRLYYEKCNFIFWKQ